MVTKNYCLMKLRDKGKYTTELNEKSMATADDTDSKIAAVEKDTHLNNMELAMEQLNVEQKLCVTLFYLQKQTYQPGRQVTHQVSSTRNCSATSY